MCSSLGDSIVITDQEGEKASEWVEMRKDEREWVTEWEGGSVRERV